MYNPSTTKHGMSSWSTLVMTTSLSGKLNSLIYSSFQSSQCRQYFAYVLVLLIYWLKNSRHFLNQSEVNLKLIITCSQMEANVTVVKRPLFVFLHLYSFSPQLLLRLNACPRLHAQQWLKQVCFIRSSSQPTEGWDHRGVRLGLHFISFKMINRFCSFVKHTERFCRRRPILLTATLTLTSFVKEVTMKAQKQDIFRPTLKCK